MPQFAANFNLSDLNGRNGFEINGESVSDYSGWSVSSAGDVNGDGFDDVIIGARGVASNGHTSGASYVVFGREGGFAPNLELSTLDGNNGVQINGEAAGDRSGDSVSSAGDVNGDGFDDLIIGAWAANPNGTHSGASYVVFGKAGGFEANLELSRLDGNNGFQINGEATYDVSGLSVSSAGDVNGDGFADIMIGASGAGSHGNDSGASYVVFGKDGGFAANLDLSTLDGSNGFQINGEAAYDGSGHSVSSAGDVNGDGFDDLIIGAPYEGAGAIGASYVVFGQDGGFAANLDLSTLDGNTGFQINGDKLGIGGDWSGLSVSSAGDVNGDGFDDVIIGAPRARSQLASYGGASYVVFGKADGFAANLDISTLDGRNGFQISGESDDDYSGRSVSSAGDVNGDGFDDIIVGAFRADPNGLYSGASYVVFGKIGGFAENLDLSTLDGDNGFRISGEASYDSSNFSVSSAGDVNGDGFDDLITGSPWDAPNGDRSGTSYVIFGHRAFTAVTITGTNIAQTSNGGYGDDTISGNGGNDTLIGWEGADILTGGTGNDELRGRSGADVLRGDAGNDTLRGGGGNDIMAGGTGTDTFSYLLINHGGDRINDFEGGGVAGGDRIDLSAIDAVAGGSDDAFQFGGTTATAHGVWYALLGGRAMLYADTDGNTATAELTLALVGVTALAAGDFIL